MAVFGTKYFSWESDNVKGTNNNDTFYVDHGIFDIDYVNGRGGYDTAVIGKSIRYWRATKKGKRFFLEGLGEYPYQNYVFTNVEKFVFSDKVIRLEKKKKQATQDSFNQTPEFNKIKGDQKSDLIVGTSSADYILGRKGDDFIKGDTGDDVLVGGYGSDVIQGGAGRDRFIVNRKLGRGKKNMDTIVNFRAGKDEIYFQGKRKGLWIDEVNGDAVLKNEKNDIIALVMNAGGLIDWSSDSIIS